MISVFLFELKHYFKNKKELIYLYGFFVSIFLLVPFGLTPEESKNQELGCMSLWVALACCASLGAQQLFRREYEQGRLECFQTLPMMLEAIILAKWLGFLVFLMIPLGAAIPVAALLYGMETEEILRTAIGLAAGAVSLSILSSLLAILTVGMERAGAVLSLILLPLSIPIMIFGAAYSRESTDILQPELLFLLGFSVFMLPLLCGIGSHSIRHSN